ncbi:MAG: hypothetical protein ACE366_19135 [Bradymonadia bacterium]
MSLAHPHPLLDGREIAVTLPPEETPPPAPAPETAEALRPRGGSGVLGWTFFDPANLVCVTLLLISAILVVLAMRSRQSPDVLMGVLLYLFLAAFLRGYFFVYYHGRRLMLTVCLLVLTGGLLLSGLLWMDRAPSYQIIRETIITLPEAPGYLTAAVLHLASAITLAIHFLLPKRWLMRVTDEMADRVGRDLATDAPLESIDADLMDELPPAEEIERR